MTHSNETTEATEIIETTCSWIVDESPWITVECGAPVHAIKDGWECEAGHHHFYYGSPSQIAEERQEAYMELHGIEAY